MKGDIMNQPAKKRRTSSTPVSREIVLSRTQTTNKKIRAPKTKEKYEGVNENNRMVGNSVLWKIFAISSRAIYTYNAIYILEED